MSEEGTLLNIKNIVENVFNFIYKGNYADKLFSKPENCEDNFNIKSCSILVCSS